MSLPLGAGRLCRAFLHDDPSLRHRLHAWLTRLDVNTNTTHNILLTACEAVANAIDHGRGASPRATVAVEGFAHPDTITVTVSDAGGGAATRRPAITPRCAAAA